MCASYGKYTRMVERLEQMFAIDNINTNMLYYSMLNELWEYDNGR